MLGGVYRVYICELLCHIHTGNSYIVYVCLTVRVYVCFRTRVREFLEYDVRFSLCECARVLVRLSV